MPNRSSVKVGLLFICGIVFGYFFPPIVIPSFVLFAAVTFAAIFFHFLNMLTLRNFLMAIGLIAFGFCRYQISLGFLPQNHISHFLDRKDPVRVSGIIIDPPEINENRTRFTVSTESIFINDKQVIVNGKTLITLKKRTRAFRYGDLVEISGRLRRPRNRRNPGEFDYESYLRKSGIYGTMSISKTEQIKQLEINQGKWFFQEIIYPTKEYIFSVVDKTVDGVEGKLLKGLLVGEKQGIPEEVQKSFANAGASHVLAVSGLHVGFIVLIFMSVFGFLRIPFRIKIGLTLLGLLFYAFIADLQPSVVRASIMATIILFGQIIERRSDIYNTVFFAALVILLFDPQALFSLGFQFSFCAVLSIVWSMRVLESLPIYRNLNHRFKEKFLWKNIVVLLAVSIGAQLGTLPLMTIYFHQIPITAIIGNLFVIPAAGLSVALGFTSVVFNLISSFVAEVYGSANWLVLFSMVHIIKWIENLPLAYITVKTINLNILMLIIIFIIFIGNIKNPVLRGKWLILFLFVGNLIIWKFAFETTSRKLRVTFLDVDQGDAAVIEFPDNKTMLIDAGEKRFSTNMGEFVVAPFLKYRGISTLDAVVISHAHADHIGGLPYILENFHVKEVIDSGQPYKSNNYDDVLRLIKTNNTYHHLVRAGDKLKGYEDVNLYILHPTPSFLSESRVPNLNNASVVFKLNYGTTDFLFMGDAEEEVDEVLIRYREWLESEIIKVGHHGSITSSAQKLVDWVEPEYAVMSVGKFNKFKHPSAAVLKRYYSEGTKVLQTKNEGAIIFESDSQTLKKIHWRKLPIQIWIENTLKKMGWVYDSR